MKLSVPTGRRLALSISAFSVAAFPTLTLVCAYAGDETASDAASGTADSVTNSVRVMMDLSLRKDGVHVLERTSRRHHHHTMNDRIAARNLVSVPPGRPDDRFQTRRCPT